jgi:cobalt-zinc-cadmium efflux system outer membrane protein
LHSLFVEALIAAARIEFFQQIQSVDQQMSRVMEVSLQAGDASRLDVALLRASVNRAVAQAVQAESQLSGFILQIKTLAGLGPEESLVLRRVADAGLPDLSRETALRLALENRPDLRAARLRESVNEAAIAVARAQATPDVVASVGYGKEKNAIEGFRPPQEKIIDRANLLSVGVSFSLPFFNRQQGNISEAISVQTQSRDQREAIEQQVRRDVLLAFERYDSARRAIDILTSGVISENQESFRIVRLSYDLGELRLIDLLNQQRVLIDTQISYLDVQRDSMLAAAELERALGTAVGGRR